MHRKSLFKDPGGVFSIFSILQDPSDGILQESLKNPSKIPPESLKNLSRIPQESLGDANQKSSPKNPRQPPSIPQESRSILRIPSPPPHTNTHTSDTNWKMRIDPGLFNPTGAVGGESHRTSPEASRRIPPINQSGSEAARHQTSNLEHIIGYSITSLFAPPHTTTSEGEGRAWNFFSLFPTPSSPPSSPSSLTGTHRTLHPIFFPCRRRKIQIMYQIICPCV